MEYKDTLIINMSTSYTDNGYISFFINAKYLFYTEN